MAAVRGGIRAYAQGAATRSWYQVRPTMSLRMLRLADARPTDSVIDIGGGAAPLTDALLEQGFTDVTVLDISHTGLSTAQERLGPAAQLVRWVHADITRWRPERRYRIWHDRAVFHFLTAPAAQVSYLHALAVAVEVGGSVIIGCFAADGPEQCSGLPVARYSPIDLRKLVSPYLTVLVTDREEHTTPAGATQPFTWLLGRR
jgi:SAM-dependent methyltransferase